MNSLRLLIMLILYVFVSTCYSGDDYMHIPLCGYGAANENPCKNLHHIKIFTGVPHGGVNDIPKMEKLEHYMINWVSTKRKELDDKKVEANVSSIGGKYNFPSPSNEELVVGVLVYYIDRNVIVTLVSATNKANQALSYSCQKDSAGGDVDICLLSAIEKGMGELLKYFL